MKYLGTMIKKTPQEKGFTLIELLASTFVIVAIGSILVGIIVSSLRGSNKTNTMVTTRQNGTYSIAQISKMLRFAQTIDAIDGVSPNTPAPGGCITNVPLPTPQPTLAPHRSVTFTSVDGGETTIECKNLNELSPAPTAPASINQPQTIASNGASLLDVTAVQIPAGGCEITCSKSTESDVMLIGVKFGLTTLQPSGGIILPEFTASSSAVEFKTSIILRNIGR